LREGARRRLPRAVFDFIDGAAEDEVTLRRNERAFDDWGLVPRVLVDVGVVDVSITLLGRKLGSPVILAPTGLCGMAAPRGELVVARAAARAGTPFTVSCLSAVTLEEIAKAAAGPLWFQLYLWRDRRLTRSLVERAAAAGYEVLVVTVDVPVLGQRERDLRNGATVPPRITMRNAVDVLSKPSWLLKMVRNPGIEFANVAHGGGKTARPFALSRYVNEQFDPSVTWTDLGWLREAWSGPIVLKGVMSVDDAQRAADLGLDGIVVSNHGGRQLDGVPGTLDALPDIAAAVGERIEVLFDGGIRRGTDILKALALGARACLIGRPYLYGLGAAGEPGVSRAVDILHAELRRGMALLGRPRIGGIDRASVRRLVASSPT
jgi:L-lactate dehydrogenase (cytochrome)